ncbi:nucleoside deaminase [Anaerosphaera aminiphila]|nr:nucleoside deaminase [Anaerosphaera aminiphila]
MNREKFMSEALKLAEISYKNNDVPIGAVVVLNNEIVGSGYNRKELLKDASEHAEIMALKNAAKHLETYHLEDCEMFVTLEPCAMCAGAIINFRLKKVYIGAKNPRFGCCGSNLNLLSHDFNHKTEVEFNILEEECSKILSSFFSSIREKK